MVQGYRLFCKCARIPNVGRRHACAVCRASAPTSSPVSTPTATPAPISPPPTAAPASTPAAAAPAWQQSFSSQVDPVQRLTYLIGYPTIGPMTYQRGRESTGTPRMAGIFWKRALRPRNAPKDLDQLEKATLARCLSLDPHAYSLPDASCGLTQA